MQVISVSQVTQHIKALVDSAPELADLWVEGEISNFHRASSGHCYFTLKDDGSELRCVIWRGLAGLLTWVPSQGDRVDAHGYVSVYERGGSYQFYADALEPGGIGLLWQEFARLRARLEAEGLFDAARKRPLPVFPRCVGIVTSPTGAALQDILHVLRSRYPLVQVIVSPTLVQGQGAAEGIVRAIRRLEQSAEVDVIIVARGGGSLEDLMCFNDERVARAVVAARVPVVAGVGHETDVTIADLVADWRAPTPTAAAAAVVPDGNALGAQIDQTIAWLQATMKHRIAELSASLSQQERMLQTFQPKRAIAERRQRLDDRLDRLAANMRHALALRRGELASRTARLAGLDTQQIIGRGYALVEKLPTGERLQSATQVNVTDELRIYIRDGQVDATVTRTHARNLRDETRTQGSVRGGNGHQRDSDAEL